MAIQQPVRRPAPVRTRRSRLPRITWSGLGISLLIGYFAFVTWPGQTVAVLVLLILLPILAAVLNRTQPQRLNTLFHRLDKAAAHLPKPAAIPRQATAAKLQNMHWTRFEEAGVEAARKAPDVAHAELTGKSGDRGCDGLVRLANGSTWLLQFKRYNAKNKVDGETVRATVGAAQLAHCTGAAIVTSSGFTKEAVTQAVKLGVVLFDGTDTAQWMNGGRAPWQ